VRSADADPDDGRPETEAQRSDRNWGDILQELRVTQTGSQILSGFLLTVAFQERFTHLDTYQYSVYGVLVGLAAVSTLLGLATVRLHRSEFHHHRKPEVVELGSRLLSITVAVVAILAAGVVLLIFDVVFGRAAGLVAGAAAAVALIVLLVILPRSIRARTSADR
jgi:high-affinity Fe2+/Pb2+ permease